MLHCNSPNYSTTTQGCTLSYTHTRTHTHTHVAHTHTHRLHQEAVSQLHNLQVWESVPLAGGQQGVTLNTAFKTNLRVMLCGGYASSISFV